MYEGFVQSKSIADAKETSLADLVAHYKSVQARPQRADISTYTSPVSPPTNELTPAGTEYVAATHPNDAQPIISPEVETPYQGPTTPMPTFAEETSRHNQQSSLEPDSDTYDRPMATRRVTRLEYVQRQRKVAENQSRRGGRRAVLAIILAGAAGGYVAVTNSMGTSTPKASQVPQASAKLHGAKSAAHDQHRTVTRTAHHLTEATDGRLQQNSTKESPVKPVSAAEKRRIEEIARRAMAASRGHHLKGETAIKGVPAKVLHTGGAPVEPKPNAKATSTKPQPGGAPASGKKTAHTASMAAAPQVRYTYPHIWEACQANGEWQVYEQDTSTSPIISYPYMPQAGTCQQGAH